MLSWANSVNTFLASVFLFQFVRSLILKLLLLPTLKHCCHPVQRLSYFYGLKISASICIFLKGF